MSKNHDSIQLVVSWDEMVYIPPPLHFLLLSLLIRPHHQLNSAPERNNHSLRYNCPGVSSLQY